MMKTRTLWFTFWPGWVISNGLGWLLFTIVYILPFGGPFWGFRISATLGLLLGLFQWTALQKNGLADSTWIWLSIFPYGLFFLALILFSSELSPFRIILLHVICFGVLGLFQRSALTYYVNRATVWVLMSPVSSIVATQISQFVSNSLLRNQYPSFYWGFSGVIYGCISGAVIISLHDSTIRDKHLS